MRRMTPEEYRAFILEGTRTAKLATVRADGRPHVAPVWFLLDGERIVAVPWTSASVGQPRSLGPVRFRVRRARRRHR